DQLIEYWRDLMVACAAGVEGQTLGVTGRHREALREQATQVKLDTVLAGLDILVSAKARARGSNHGRVLLEMALVRLSRLDDLVPLAQLAQLLGQAQDGGARGASPRSGAQAAAAGVAVPPAPRVALPAEASKKKELNGSETSPNTPQLTLTPESLPQVWPQVLEQVGLFLANHLRKAHSLAIPGPNTLAIRFAPSYNHSCERCQEPA